VRRLAKPERTPRRAPAISRVECGSGGACASSPAPELGFGADDMAAPGMKERRRGAKRREEATNGDGVGAAAAIGYSRFLCFSTCLVGLWEGQVGASRIAGWFIAT